MRKILGLIVGIASCLIASAQGNTETMRFAAVSNYWEWSSYFGIDGLDFPEVPYQNGASFSALVFYDDYPVDNKGRGYSTAYWGFCSSEIGVCQAYAADSNGAVDGASGTKIQKGESEEQALARFRSWEFASAPIGGPATVAVQPPTPVGANNRRPAIDPRASRPVGIEDQFTIRTLRRRITLPMTGIPSAVVRKIANSKAENEVKKVLYNPKSRSGCTIIVPFADERVAKLPVLVDCPKNSSVTIVSKHSDEWFFTHGGAVEDRSIIERLAPHIRASASLTLKE